MHLKKLFLNLYFWPAFAIITLLAVVLVLPPVLLIGWLSRSTARLVRQGIRIYGFVLVRIVPFMAPVKVEYREPKMPRPAIFIANHCSAVDPYLFGMLPCENAFVTSWPFHIPVYNLVMRLAQYINSTLGWENVHKECEKLLNQGCSIIIWPEGHRSRDGQPTRFHNGAFRLSCRTKVPIVPVCILGTHAMLPPGRRLLSPARLKVVVLPALPPQGDPDNSQDIKAFKKQARNAITAELTNHGLMPATRDMASAPAPVCTPISFRPQSNG